MKEGNKISCDWGPPIPPFPRNENVETRKEEIELFLNNSKPRIPGAMPI